MFECKKKLFPVYSFVDYLKQMMLIFENYVNCAILWKIFTLYIMASSMYVYVYVFTCIL